MNNVLYFAKKKKLIGKSICILSCFQESNCTKSKGQVPFQTLFHPPNVWRGEN